jgi:hypothetical protein
MVLGVLLAPIATFAFWLWTISSGFVSTGSTFGHGLAVAGVVFLFILLVAAIAIILPIALVLKWFGYLSFFWLVLTSVVVALLWRHVLDLAILGELSTRSGRDSLWDAAYALVMSVTFCLVSGIPFRLKSSPKAPDVA